MKNPLFLLIAGSLLSSGAFAGDWNCKEGHDEYAGLTVKSTPIAPPVVVAAVPETPTTPEATEGKILLAGDAPCNPKVTVCED